MAHLTSALDQGQDIGHYGRLVYAIIARHFRTDEEPVAQLAKKGSFRESGASDLVRQVQDANYSRPRQDTSLEYMEKQDFSIRRL